MKRRKRVGNERRNGDKGRKCQGVENMLDTITIDVRISNHSLTYSLTH